MRLERDRDSRQHADLLSIGTDDHHPRPKSVSFTNTSQSLPPGTTYDLDVSLGNSDYQFARAIMYGPRAVSGSTLKEGGEIMVTRDASEAMGLSCIDTTMSFRVYVATYSKANGDARLTNAVFDSNPANGADYIALQDAVLTGSVLRLTFKNLFGGSATLWVKGQALVW